MATDVTTEVVRLSDLVNGQVAVCFAALLRKERGTDKNDKPFVKCHFRDKRSSVVAPFWASNALREEAEMWAEGIAYRLHLKATFHVRWGKQVDVISARPANDTDSAEGYDFFDLVESSGRDPEELFGKIVECVEKCVDEVHLKQLVFHILHEHADLFKKMPAAQSFHHSYTAGLIEHVWSMTRIASWLAGHYARYYHGLNPPLNIGVVVAATVLHDIGKLRELEYHPVEAKYTKTGNLIGHILMGRDMVREAARKIDGFPEETLLLLEHAILAHHGKLEFGSPILPKTVEALLVSFIDDLDAKMNIAVHERMTCTNEGDFTNKVYGLDRRLYKGIPVPADHGEDDPELP